MKKLMMILIVFAVTAFGATSAQAWGWHRPYHVHRAYRCYPGVRVYGGWCAPYPYYYGYYAPRYYYGGPPVVFRFGGWCR